MNVCMFVSCCAIMITFSGYGTYGYPYEEELYEGSQCETEHGTVGNCQKLLECPSKLADALAGRTRRCGFDGDSEIICCPLELGRKVRVRPAEIACQEYANEVTSDIYPVDLETSTHSAESSTHATETSTQSVETLTHDPRKVNPFIYGGTIVVSAREFPYMAALGYENTDGEIADPIVYDCGGVLITSKYILTAAHCVSNINNRVPKWARVGSADIRARGAQEIPVDRLMAHPKYKRSQNYNDIALVLLKVSARFSPSVKPICLETRALENSNINSRTSFVVIGFGATANRERSEKLMKTANLRLIPTAVCNESYTDSSKLPVGLDRTMICAVDSNFTRGSDACQGDSGGPLLMISETGDTVMAVTSFGQSCGTVIPGVYTSVYSYLDWIESKVWPDITTKH